MLGLGLFMSLFAEAAYAACLAKENNKSKVIGRFPLNTADYKDCLTVT